MQILTCRFCETPLEHTFCNLGTTPLANSYLSPEALHVKEPFYPLHAYVCSKCLLIQLPSLHTPQEIFNEYAYFSSYSSSWLSHAQNYATMVSHRFRLTPQSKVVEIASNDGYLLQFFQRMHIPVLGIEPAKNVAEVAIKKGIATIVDFFGCTLAQKHSIQADLLVGNNVLAHVPNLNDFVAAMKQCLSPHGIITMEFPHLLNLMESNQFDTIYHEHFSYFSFHSVKKVFAHHGLELFDVEALPTHGGSLRIYAQHCQGPQPHSHRLELLEQIEIAKGMHKLDTYLAFEEKIARIKREILEFFEHTKNDKKRVVGYGAPAKGNTLLNFCKISEEHLPFTVDKNPYKQGKFLPGSHLPIYPVEKIVELKPDYLLILPWNLQQEIMQEMSCMQNWGGKFVTFIPQLQIVKS